MNFRNTCLLQRATTSFASVPAIGCCTNRTPSTANYNGQFTFSSLAAYQAGTPSLFSLTAGQSAVTLVNGDLGAYVDDEWKLGKTLTANIGFRLESQTSIPDRLNPAPRAGIAWAIGRRISARLSSL